MVEINDTEDFKGFDRWLEKIGMFLFERCDENNRSFITKPIENADLGFRVFCLSV